MKTIWQRRGKYCLTGHLIEESTFEDLKCIFESMVVLRTTENLWEDTIEYYCVSPLFDEVAEGTKIPEYVARVVDTDEGRLVEWRKVHGS